MISRISEALKINNLLYLYNEKELNYMLNEIYENLDVNEIDIINFLNNNLIYSGKMINNKYIFTNIFYLYFFVNIFYFLFIYVILTSHNKRTFDKVSCGYG